jgi:integrase
VLIVRRALSGTVERSTKSRKVRYVPLADQARAALDRLAARAHFTGLNDYVFATLAGDRPDPSALRRRYVTCRDEAQLPRLRFHDLRHTAGTLLVRVIDPVSVKDINGSRRPGHNRTLPACVARDAPGRRCDEGLRGES